MFWFKRGSIGAGFAGMVMVWLSVWLPASAAPGQLVTGYYHSCAIVAGGAVKCWGLGAQGELGNGRLANAAVPQLVKGLKGVQELAAGYQWTCARLADGGVRCWGITSGRFASAADRRRLKSCTLAPGRQGLCAPEPLTVSGLNHIRRLDASANFLYAIDAGGRVRAVKLDAEAAEPPIQGLPQLSGVSAVSGLRSLSDQTAGCALRQDGRVVCWHSNALYGAYQPDCAVRQAQCSVRLDGQDVGLTGDEAPAACAALRQAQPRLRPMRWSCQPAGAQRQRCTYLPADLEQSSHLELVFQQDASVKVFYPERVNPDAHAASNCEVPLTAELDRRPVVGLERILRLAGNNDEGMYALAADGAVWFWGQTTGVAGFLPPPLPVLGAGDPGGHALRKVSALQGSTQLRENAWVGCAVQAGGALACWGYQHHLGLVGVGQPEGFVDAPQRLNLPPVAAVELGHAHACAQLVNHRVRCWGDNHYAQLGAGFQGPFSALPVEVPNLELSSHG